MAIKIEVGRGEFTSFGGLVLADQLARKCKLRQLIAPHLPHQEHKKKKESDYQKFLSLAYGFIAGADCISDIQTLYKVDLCCRFLAMLIESFKLKQKVFRGFNPIGI